jgi:glutamate--cysteine ligase catalytic subunit
MTMDEIMNGQQQQEDGFPGLIPLVHSYLNSTNIDVETRCRLTKYLDLISRRASGELMTGASYLRQLVMQHPDYQHDSVVSSSITYDIVMAADALAEGRLQAPELLGDNLL